MKDLLSRAESAIQRDRRDSTNANLAFLSNVMFFNIRQDGCRFVEMGDCNVSMAIHAARDRAEDLLRSNWDTGYAVEGLA